MDGLPSVPAGLVGMRLQWSPVWRQEWTATPESYVEAGVVGRERARRLLRGDDDRLGLRVYLGVRHSDPARWAGAGEERAEFFASALLGRRTLYLHTYTTADAALAALGATRQRLLAGPGATTSR